jgi:hypothetical protein
LLAVLLAHIKGAFHVAVDTASDKADGVGVPQFVAGADAASAQNAVVVPEGITYCLNAAADGDVLDSAGIRCLRNQQLGDIMAKPLDPIRIGPDDHAFLYFQRARGSYRGAAIGDVLNDAESAGSYIRKIGDVAKVGDTDTVFNSRFKYAGALGGPNISVINIKGYIVQHVSPHYLT